MSSEVASTVLVVLDAGGFLQTDHLKQLSNRRIVLVRKPVVLLCLRTWHEVRNFLQSTTGVQLVTGNLRTQQWWTVVMAGSCIWPRGSFDSQLMGIKSIHREGYESVQEIRTGGKTYLVLFIVPMDMDSLSYRRIENPQHRSFLRCWEATTTPQTLEHRMSFASSIDSG